MDTLDLVFSNIWSRKWSNSMVILGCSFLK